MTEITPALLASALPSVLGGTVSVEGLTRGPIGNGQETWFLVAEIDGARRELVLRRTAAAGPLEWTDRAVETAATREAGAIGLPVPEVLATVVDPTVLGAPFMLMARMPGEAVVRSRGEERRRLTTALAAALAQLHAEGPRDPTGRDGAAATRDEVIRWRDRYTADRLAPLPLLDALLAWLTANVPASLAAEPAVLLWGDAGAHNALGAAGRLTALLDFELAHHGHPLEDLACAAWMERTPEDGRALVAAYAEVAGRTVDPEVLRYFRVLMGVTRSVMIVGGGAAFATGRTWAPNLAGLALDLPTTSLAAAAEEAGWGPAPAALAPPAVADADDALHPTGAEIDAGVAAFLAAEVLEEVADPRTRRGVKTAVALLRTAALRARAEAAVTDLRREATAALLADLARDGVTGDLATVAAAVESDEGLAHLRPRVRAHLLADLAHVRGLLAPLHELYHRRG